MVRTGDRLLTVTRALIRIGRIIIGFLMLALGWMLATLLTEPHRVTVRAGLGSDAVANSPATAGLGIVAGLLIAGLMLPVLGKLLDVVQSVDGGHPFTPENGGRLRAIGWLLLVAHGIGLGTYLLIFPLRTLQSGASTQLLGFMAITSLFVIARVFDAGALMQSELDGTV
jgi:hypothetical protein